MLRPLLAQAEVCLAALIFALTISCGTTESEPSGAWAAEVVRVEHTISETGEPIARVTLAWEHDGTYEQATLNVPFGSREGTLRQGQHVWVVPDSLNYVRVVSTE